MATPTKATDNVAHAAVALAVTIIVPTLISKGHRRAILAGIAGAVLHMMLDARGCPKSRRTWAAVPVIIRPRSRFHHDRRR